MTDRQKKFGGAFAIAAVIVAWVLTLAGFVWAAAGQNAKINTTAEVVNDHERRIRTIEDKTTRIDTNVELLVKQLVPNQHP